MNFYQSNPATLSDAELLALIAEIEYCGALACDQDDFDPDDWEYQAIDRFHALTREKERRWELAHPEEADRRRKTMLTFARLNDYIHEHITPEVTDAVFRRSRVFDVLGKT